MTLSVQVRYFAALREALGEAEHVGVARGATIAALRSQLVASSPRHAHALSADRTVRCALNLTMCPETTLLTEGAEVAFFPPVTGG